MLKYCNFKPHGIVFADSGASIRDLTEHARNNRIVFDWNKYELVIISCGTNDVANGYYHLVAYWIDELYRLLRSKNPDLHVVVNGILPRPVDYEWSRDIVVTVNDDLRKWAADNEGTGFYPAYTCSQKTLSQSQSFSLGETNCTCHFME